MIPLFLAFTPNYEDSEVAREGLQSMPSVQWKLQSIRVNGVMKNVLI